MSSEQEISPFAIKFKSLIRNPESSSLLGRWLKNPNETVDYDEIKGAIGIDILSFLNDYSDSESLDFTISAENFKTSINLLIGDIPIDIPSNLSQRELIEYVTGIDPGVVNRKNLSRIGIKILSWNPSLAMKLMKHASKMGWGYATGY